MRKLNWMAAVVAALVVVGGGAGASAYGAAVLEVRGEVAVLGAEVRVKQIARWGREDRAYFASLAEVVVARFEPGQKEMVIELGTVRELLAAVGVGGDEVAIKGAVTTKVTRLDAGAAYAQRAGVDRPKDLEGFLDSHGAAPAPVGPGGVVSGGVVGGGAVSGEAGASAGGTGAGGAGAGGAVESGAAANAPGEARGPAGEGRGTEGKRRERDAVEGRARQAGDEQGAEGAGRSEVGPLVPAAEVVTLRRALQQDLADRIGMKSEDLELVFDAGDERVLRLTRPAFEWSIVPRRAGNLGAVSWVVTLWGGGSGMSKGAGGGGREVSISARARGWQTQVVATQAMARGQRVREGDVEERRVLVERLADDAGVSLEQSLMMQAGRAVQPGTALTMKMLEPVMLVRAGQVITIVVKQGAFEVKSVGRAMESGAYGQRVRVKNEATNEVLQVMVVGEGEGRV